MSAQILPFVKHNDRSDQNLQTQINSEWLGYVRDGGAVKRCHTLVVIGEQTVAAHSWGVAMIIMRLWPDYSKALMQAALTHDVAERWTGDVPADAKWRSPALKFELSVVEAKVEKELGIHLILNAVETEQLKWADRLELIQFCLDQRKLGNRNMDIVFARVIDYLKQQPGFSNWLPAIDLRDDLNKQYNFLMGN